MTKALITVFYQNDPRVNNHFKTQGDIFLKLLRKWSDELDCVYLIDAGWGFANSIPKANLLKEDRKLHWDYFNQYVPQIKEDLILMVDSDTLIYDPEIIKKGFNLIENEGFNVASILDNSGSFDLFPANENRDVRRRLAPYLCFIKKDFLMSVADFDFTPIADKYDSMGKICHQLVNSKKMKLYEFPDDRTTLRMDEKDHWKRTKDTWLDGPGFKWSIPLDKSNDFGYYHIRNSTLGLCMLNEFKHDQEAYQRRKKITPFSEAMRLIAWQWIYDKAAGRIQEWQPSFEAVLIDYKVRWDNWLNYLNDFKDYHPWIERELNE